MKRIADKVAFSLILLGVATLMAAMHPALSQRLLLDEGQQLLSLMLAGIGALTVMVLAGIMILLYAALEGDDET